jgi:tetraacyldisaccharide 4'-kinase
MKNWLERQWYRNGIAQFILWPISLLFGALVWLRRMAYRLGLLPIGRLPVPVIVVGNITVGGTGKTPLVIWLVAFLRGKGFHPGVISRGYGGRVTRPTAVNAASDPAVVGDEPVLIARRLACPVWVGPDRFATARSLMQVRPDCDVLICDDGLQHYRLGRDLEIAVVDGSRGLGNGRLLPAGPLREPRDRLKSVNLVVTNGAQGMSGSLPMELNGAILRNLSKPGRVTALADWAGQALHAVAGIGNPDRFFEHLRRAGLQIEPHAFPDHHPFQPGDFAFGDGRPVIMTEKDAVKCIAFASPDWWYLEVNAEIEESFGMRVLQKLEK